MTRRALPALLALVPLLLATRAAAQACDQAIGETLISDLSSLNPIYVGATARDGDAAVGTGGTVLTTTAAASHGSLFFSAPTDFQGTGGFSLKFVLQATGAGGDAWEAVVATDTGGSLVSAEPPFGVGAASAGLAGWSRNSAFVVEFDAHDSGASENDADASHVAIYLSGSEVCKTSLAVDLASGDKYTVWLDFDGFATRALVRVSAANDAARPTSPTLECIVDIWGALLISSGNHVGFAAYNPVGADGAIHRLVDGISLADGFKPYDVDDCASYAKCSAKTESGLCTKDRGDSATCDIIACTGGWIWDVAGTSCCAFVERTSWVVAAGVSGFNAGDIVSCTQTRRTIAYPTTADNCN